MGYVCLKSLMLGDTNYNPGDPIPSEAVAASRVRPLAAYGYIKEVNISDFSEQETGGQETGEKKPDTEDHGGQDDSKNPTEEKVQVEGFPVNLTENEDGSKEAVFVSASQIQSVFDTMRKGAKEAAEAIGDEVDLTVLEIIRTIDSRKTVKEAVDKQLTIISTIMNDGNASTGDSGPTEGNGKGTPDQGR